MKLILHIGTEKTGSTSIQQWLGHHFDELQRRGIWYSRALGRPANRKLAVYGRDTENPDDGLKQHQITTEPEHEVWRGQLEQELRAEVEEATRAGTHTFVASSEHCHSRLVSDRMVERVRDLLSPHFEQRRVVCFIRPQLELLLSSLTAKVHAGLKLTDRSLDVKPDHKYFDYLGLYRRWARAFGAEQVEMLPFDAKQDVVGRFARLVGPALDDLPGLERENTSLDYRVMAMANNIQIPRWNGNHANRNRGFFLKEFAVEEKVTIARERARKIQARFDEANRQLASECPGLAPTALQPDFDEYPETGNFGQVLRDVPFQDQLTELVLRFNAELWLERARTQLAEARVALAEGAERRALRSMRKAERFARFAQEAGLQSMQPAIDEIVAALHRKEAGP